VRSPCYGCLPSGYQHSNGMSLPRFNAIAVNLRKERECEHLPGGSGGRETGRYVTGTKAHERGDRGRPRPAGPILPSLPELLEVTRLFGATAALKDCRVLVPPRIRT